LVLFRPCRQPWAPSKRSCFVFSEVLFPFVSPRVAAVHIAQPDAPDLADAHSIHRKQQQDRAVPYIVRMIGLCTCQQALHIRP
jgi:hypothetical protein